MNRQLFQRAYCVRGCTAGACRRCRVAWHWLAVEELRLHDARCPQCGGQLRASWHGAARFEWRHGAPRSHKAVA